MKVVVELVGLYNITDKLGFKKKELELEDGATVRSVLDAFLKKYPWARRGLVKDDGSLDDDIQVFVNGEKMVERNEISKEKVNNGDKVTFMLLLTGG